MLLLFVAKKLQDISFGCDRPKNCMPSYYFVNELYEKNLVNKRVEKEENEKKFKINERRIKLFLDVITIAAIQSCAENVSEQDKKKFAKVLMEKVYKGFSSKVRNQKGCKSAFRYRCGF